MDNDHVGRLGNGRWHGPLSRCPECRRCAHRDPDYCWSHLHGDAGGDRLFVFDLGEPFQSLGGSRQWHDQRVNKQYLYVDCSEQRLMDHRDVRREWNG